MTPRQVKEFAEKKEADFAIGVPGVGRFRTNVYQQRGTLAFAFRAIPYEVKTIKELDLPAVLEEIAAAAARAGAGHRAHRLGQVHGARGDDQPHQPEPPGQHHHDRGPDRVPPPRHACANIYQREVGNDTLSFGSALRHVLRQDPDVILIGEIRDLETLDTALKAADTGHLVFSTLHTTDATQTINRIISFYPPHQHDEVRMLLVDRAAGGRLAPPGAAGRWPGPGAGGRGPDQHRRRCATTSGTSNKTLNIPDLIADGPVQYGMQSFDQSLHAVVQGGRHLATRARCSTAPTRASSRSGCSGVDSGVRPQRSARSPATGESARRQ